MTSVIELLNNFRKQKQKRMLISMYQLQICNFSNNVNKYEEMGKWDNNRC